MNGSLCALLLATGCSRAAQEAPSDPPASALCASPAPEPSASASAPPDTGAPEPAGALVFARVQRELDERCDPKKHPASETSLGLDPESMPGLRFTASWVGACMSDVVGRELDDARARLRAASPARAAGLAKEQAELARYGESICRLTEKAEWFDLDEGRRYDGTMRGIAYWSAWFGVHHERLFYVRAVAADDAASLAARVREQRAAGTAAKKEIARMRARSQILLPRAPPRDDGKTSPFVPLLKEDLRLVISLATEAEARAPALARSSCGWEALARELGGEDACAPEMELYYFAHWSEQPIR